MSDIVSFSASAVVMPSSWAPCEWAALLATRAPWLAAHQELLHEAVELFRSDLVENASSGVESVRQRVARPPSLAAADAPLDVAYEPLVLVRGAGPRPRVGSANDLCSCLASGQRCTVHRALAL